MSVPAPVPAARRAWPFVAAIGVTGGLAAGLLGIGGGLVMVPLLSTWLGVPLKRAIGTSLLAVAGIALLGVGVELLVAPANVDFKIAALLAGTAIVGAAVGVWFLRLLPVGTLARLMAVVLALAALRMGWGQEGWAPATVPGVLPAVPEATRFLALAAGGFLAGVVSSLFGIGGGLVAVPVLAMAHPEWAFQAARATSLAMIVPTALAGTLLHRRHGTVDVQLALLLLPSAVAACALAVVIANRVPGRPLEILFAAVLVVSAARLWRRHAGRDADAPT